MNQPLFNNYQSRQRPFTYLHILILFALTLGTAVAASGNNGTPS